MLINALIPIILPILFIVFMKYSAKKGMVYSSLIFVVATYFIWKMEVWLIIASILQGIFNSLNILLILFGAITLLNTLKKTKAIEKINIGFLSLSKDMRIQVILVGFLFGSLIEGASGFGTPAVVVGPLLVALGFSPLSAATLALISDSTAVSYGAVGTPVIVGLSNLNFEYNELLEIASRVTYIDLFAGSFIPLILVFILTTFFNGNNEKKLKYTLEMLPFALVVGFTYTLSAYLIVNFIGIEFTSILAPIITLIIAAILTKYKILTPKEVWTLREDVELDDNKMSLFTAWLPYLIVVILLLLTRTVPAVLEFVKVVNIQLNSIIGYSEVNFTWFILYSPGMILIISSILASVIQSKSLKSFFNASRESFNKMSQAAITLMFTLAMVQIFSNSGINAKESMPMYIASELSYYLGSVWYLVAPFIGQLGAFITGSATVSNLTFGPIQYEVALISDLEYKVTLAEQVLGGASGNMICIHNIVAASTVVGLIGKEGSILKKTFFPALFYGTVVAIIAFLLY